MTRTKTTPQVHKPAFDADGVLHFAAQGGTPILEDTDRVSLTLVLKAEVISRLKAEASRKEKTINQVVEKLVSKHLGKH